MGKNTDEIMKGGEKPAFDGSQRFVQKRRKQAVSETVSTFEKEKNLFSWLLFLTATILLLKH